MLKDRASSEKYTEMIIMIKAQDEKHIPILIIKRSYDRQNHFNIPQSPEIRWTIGDMTLETLHLHGIHQIIMKIIVGTTM